MSGNLKYGALARIFQGTVGQNVKIGRRARPRKNAASGVFLAKLHNKTSESGSYK